MRNVFATTYLQSALRGVLQPPRSIGQTEQIESVSDVKTHNEPHENRFDRTERTRHFDLHQDELTGCLSEYEIDCARRRGWM